MAWIDSGETRALTRLPNLEIEVLHKPARDGRGEQVAILLSAGPRGAPAMLLGLAQPMLLWMRFLQAAWAPWLPTHREREEAAATSPACRGRP